MSDYKAYQDAKDREYLAACIAHGIEPFLYRDSSSNPSEEEHDPFQNLASPAPDHRYFDDPVEVSPEADCRAAQANAVLRVLYLLTNSRHPQLRLQAECLLASINRTDEKSQAAIARKYGVTRAAISKRMRDMRRSEFLSGLEIYFFGGTKEASEKARERANHVHNRRKQTLCKTSSPTNPPGNSILRLLPSLPNAA